MATSPRMLPAPLSGGTWLDFARRSYRPSRQVEWSRFLPFAALTLTLAALGATLLHFLVVSGFYTPGLMPLILAFALHAPIIWTIRQGHCRHPGWAAAFGFLSSAVLLGGSYYLGMQRYLETLDPRHIGEFLRWRNENFEFQPLFGPFELSSEPVDAFTRFFNWTMLILGWASSVFFCVLPPAGRVLREPYCEHCRRWADREILTLPPGSALDLIRGSTKGGLARLLRRLSFERSPDQPALLAALHICTKGVACQAEPRAWLTLRSHGRLRGALSPFNPLESVGARDILTAAELDPVSVPALKPLVEELTAQRARTAPAVVAVPRRKSESASNIATIEPAPDPAVKTRAVLFVSQLSTFLLAVPALTGVVLLGYADSLASPSESELLPAWMLPAEPLPPTLLSPLVPAIFGAAAVLMALTLLIGLRHPQFFEGWTVLKLLRRRLAKRPDLSFDPRQEGVFLVEYVPRRNWTRALVDEADDVGFVYCDLAQGVLHFEGANDRYWIPGEAIVDISPAGYDLPAGFIRITKSFAVLQVRLAEGVVELPLACRYVSLYRGLRHGRKSAADELIAAIQAIPREAGRNT